MKRKTLLWGALVALGAFAALIVATGAFAFDSGGNPGGTGPNTINWTGNGFPVSQECGTSADPGHGGFQNGATANDYMLWIFNTDGGSIDGGWTLTVGGTTYSGSSGNQLVTPAVDPTGAYASFDVTDPGSGAWILTISHGCGGTTPPASDLTATKTATPSFDRDYDWSVQKSQTTSATPIDSSASSVSVNYQVTATWSGPTDSGWQVGGDITVNNPNDIGSDVTGVSVTDAIENETNASCSVDAGSPGSVDPTNGTIPGASSIDFPYVCTYSQAPAASSQTNEATITWPEQTLANGSDLAGNSGNPLTATADIDWTSVTPNVTHDTTTVKDAFHGGSADTLGVANVDGTFTKDPGNMLTSFASSYGSASQTFTFTYARSVTVVPNTCTEYDNTATISPDATSGDNSSSASVVVCGPVTGGLTIGFWSNKNGKARLCANDPAWRQLLDGTAASAPYNGGSYLRNANGTIYTVPTTGTCANADTSFSSWLLSASSKNASYMLSAQLAGAILNVNFNGMNGNVCIAGNGGTPITINNLIATVITFLQANGNTTAAGPARTLAVSYQTILNSLNNGQVFAVTGC